jgi:rare lipoprotein A
MKTHRRARGRRIARALAAFIVPLVASGAAIAVAATPTQQLAASGSAKPRSESARGTIVKLKVHAVKNLLAGSNDRVHGSLSTHQAGQTVVVESRQGTSWQNVAQVRTGRKGHFSAEWQPGQVGRYAVRARLSDGTAQGKPKGKVTAYRESNVSYYGPGFYGHGTACGETLEPNTLGVANKTLPCGTKVALYYQGRKVTVPVIDRGPYVSGREYDLTAATRDRLGCPSTGTIWSAPL